MTTPDAAMTGAEMRTTREFLGLSAMCLALWLGVSERKVRRWEVEELPIPDGVAAEIGDLYEEAHEQVEKWIAITKKLIEASDGDVELHTYRTDEDYWRASDQPGVGKMRLPASYHRMICARVADAVPGVVVTYA